MTCTSEATLREEIARLSEQIETTHDVLVRLDLVQARIDLSHELTALEVDVVLSNVEVGDSSSLSNHAD